MRIRRLEDKVRALTAQVTELKASRADLQFRLEEEQQLATEKSRASSAGEAAQPTHLELQDALEDPRELRRQLMAVQADRAAREAELLERLARARSVNDTLATHNRELVQTLDGTLSTAEHVSAELRQLRNSHAELKAAREAAQKQASQLQSDLELRERALSAVQSEFTALRRRYEEALVAAEAARREAALREGRLRRELDGVTQEAANTATALTKLQREHATLHSRKAEKDRQLAAMTRRAEAQQEALAGAERLAQEQSGKVATNTQKYL
ncbi:hypothetical protein GPECTOR_96g729 [Gonium pectorale]|uniref:Uncharacterized protein n=1 Tax=Gonium pectorale TaxID=33097 RepID=A0A150G057_GONPE|nr:hypothetical protein GPECTOR_96g729 [Gonium pectorale]|eukprot:KXZ43263.1 hypothetical protein GPECTOR_96g729 [Gonium pectorale]